MNVSVVITCWNGRKLLEKNLPSVLKAASNKDNNIKEIIVVDDGSTDDSVNYIQGLGFRVQGLEIKLIVHDKNYGYAKTCNTGVEATSGELVAILNLDVVPEKDFLKAALPHFENNKIFAVSFNEGHYGPGKIVWENGMLGIGATKLPLKTCLTGWPSGGSSVFRKSIWKELGGMDLLFLPFYYEDFDLGIRAAKAGYKCLFEPKSKVEHKHESTINSESFKSGFILKIKERNRLILTWKNLDSPKLIFSHLGGLIKRSSANPGFSKIIFAAAERIGIIPLLFNSKSGERGDRLSTADILRVNEEID